MVELNTNMSTQTVLIKTAIIHYMDQKKKQNIPITRRIIREHFGKIYGTNCITKELVKSIVHQLVCILKLYYFMYHGICYINSNTFNNEY